MMNVPEIRFKGFTDAWEQRRLGETLSEKISNGVMNRPGRNPLNVKHINVVNLYTPSQIQPSELMYFDATEKDLQKCNVTIGDIFLTRSSLKLEGIAQANILLDEGNYVFDDHIMRIKLTPEFEPFFIKEALNHSSTKKDFMTKAKTGTMTTIGQDDITSSGIAIPIKAEQSRIGNFFRTLDNIIAIYKRKLDGLRELKKAYLQLMFPQTGDAVPKMRFEGFTDEWKEIPLEQILTERKQRQKITDDLPLLAFAAGQGVIDRSERRTNNRDFLTHDSASKVYLLTHKDDIVYNPSNLKYGAIDRNKYGSGVISPIYVTFETSEIPSFVELIVTSEALKDKALQYEEGTVTKRQSVKPEMLLTLTVVIPANRDEQLVIGNFFCNLDAQVAFLTEKLKQFENLKRAYLQKMFI